MPNRQYLEVAGKSYLSSVNDDGETWEDVERYDVLNYLLTTKIGGFNSLLMNRADAVNDVLYVDGEYITAKVNSYYIVGTNVDTMMHITVDASNPAAVFEVESKNCGDGTVELWSASLGGLYPERTFYVENAVHSEELINGENVLNKVIDIINGNPDSEIDGITQEAPIYEE